MTIILFAPTMMSLADIDDETRARTNEARRLAVLEKLGKISTRRIDELAAFTDTAAAIMADRSLMFSTVPADISRLIIVWLSAGQSNPNIWFMYGTVDFRQLLAVLEFSDNGAHSGGPAGPGAPSRGAGRAAP